MSANLVLNVLPRFPAHIRATDGLVVAIENAVDLVVKPDFGALVPVPAVTNPAMTYFQAWDKSIDYYQSISFQDFSDNLADQVLAGTLLALKNVTFAADQGVYFSNANTANAYALSAFVRGISGSSDATAFKTALTLSKSDVGLSNVDNTSDAGKPVSTAQQTAINLKANLASPTFTGDPKAPTPTAGDNDTSIATTAFVTAAIAAAPFGIKRSATVTASGAAIDFAVPTGAVRVGLTLNGISTTGTSTIIAQLGDAGGVETTGYASGGIHASNASAASVTPITNGYLMMIVNAATEAFSGSYVMDLVGSIADWVGSGVIQSDGTTRTTAGAGRKPLAPGPITTLRLTTANGTDTFDAGTVTAFWEF